MEHLHCPVVVRYLMMGVQEVQLEGLLQATQSAAHGRQALDTPLS